MNMRKKTAVSNDGSLGKKIDNGFQLFKDRFFIKPLIDITHRAYYTKLLDVFKQLDDK
jgi:hypothetical protein